MTDLTDLWDLPEPHGYHDHDGPRVGRMWLEMELGMEPSDQPAPELKEEWPLTYDAHLWNVQSRAKEEHGLSSPCSSVNL